MALNNIIENTLWTEKYRPKTLDDGCVLPTRIKSMLENGVVQSMLLFGTPGIGKTTVAKAICNQFGHNVLYLNMSENTGVDTIRDTIMDFALNQSVIEYKNPIKVVIMDEMDFMSQNAFAALRASMEKCAATTRFIGTCNFVNKIPEPIQSRFQMIDFNFTQEEELEIKKGQIKRVIEICKKEGMEIDVKAAGKIVLTHYPDFRSIVSQLQRYKLEGKTKIEVADVKDSASEFAELFDLCILGDDPVANYKMVMENYSGTPDEAVASLGQPFMEYIMKSKPNLVTKLPNIAIINAKYQSCLKNAIDPIITLLANVYELQQELQK